VKGLGFKVEGVGFRVQGFCTLSSAVLPADGPANTSPT
jgi:hypothetical protein